MKQRLSTPSEETAAPFIDMQEEHRRDRRLLAVGFDAVLGKVQKLGGARLSKVCRPCV